MNELAVTPRIERERLDRLAQWLEVTIGARLTAYAAGTTPDKLSDVSQGEDAPDELDRRLRNLYALTFYISAIDGAGTAHEWLVEPNVELDSKAPAELLHDGEPPEAVWLAAAPAF